MLLRSLLFLGIASHAFAQLTPTGSLIAPRKYHSATLLNNGKVLITGGWEGDTALATAELYDPATGAFSATGDMLAVQVGHSATLLPNGKVLIAGGESRLNLSGAAVATAELYDPATGTFSATGNMTLARAGHTATLLNNGQVLIAGGTRGEGYMTGAELYDPVTGTFTPTGDMTEPGCETATLLADGRVLLTRWVAGGNHAELYDPATGTFRRTGNFLYADQGIGPAALLLPNGKVLIAGGDLDLYFSANAELYDPATGVFTAANNMPDGLADQRVTLLGDGTAFIVGGGFIRATPSLSICCTGLVELYYAGTNEFRSSGRTPSVGGQTATLLPDGTVLLTGGWQYGPAPATFADAQIYRPPVPVRAPVLYSVGGGAQGAILHAATHQLVSPANPAVAGEVLEIYGAGLIDGGVIPPQVAIGGRLAEVQFFGNAPGFAGLNQVNVRVPAGVSAGPDIPVRLNYLSRPSNEVTIGMR